MHFVECAFAEQYALFNDLSSCIHVALMLNPPVTVHIARLRFALHVTSSQVTQCRVATSNHCYERLKKEWGESVTNCHQLKIA